ncbi:MAG: sigma 54-interacting transcriptional regulator [Ectothiorhodospiraceae bacterium]|nr:sigma 54-interacting transcriptional regulator [Ectothiorhodospiraceae bacterium]
MAQAAESTTDLALESLVLSESAQLFGRSLEPEATVPAVLRLLSQLMGLNRGRVVLPDEDGGALRIRHSYGLRPEERRRGVYAPGEGITGQVMASGRVSVVQDVDAEPGFLFRAVDRETLPPGTVCFIAVPIIMDGAPLGVLACHRLRNRPRAFQADLHVLQIIAAMIGQTLRLSELVHERTSRLEQQNRALRSALEREGLQHGILGSSPLLKEALQQATRVAATDATVMLLGESGTGKEKFARMIHTNSERRDGPFVCINCAAIPEQLLETELFGHERGAFTGAVRTRQGKVELAEGGTLFLDEIGDMNLELQAKLLRLLQEKTVQRVGGDRDIPVNIRVITATHQDLQKAVNQGRFRLDLFYRLNVIPLHLPALRDRVGDVALLARHFLGTFNHRHRRSLTLGSGVIARLESFPWPGNIRQLENVIERTVLVVDGPMIGAADIEQILREESTIGTADASAAPPSDQRGGHRTSEGSSRPYQRVHETAPEVLRAAIHRCRGNKTQAARELGLSARQLHYRLKKLGLSNQG